MKRPSNRDGFALVLALVVLGALGPLTVVLVRSALAQERVRLLAERSAMARWMAVAGADRARARLARADDYTGEVWGLPPEAIGGRLGGEVRIEVAPVADQPDARLVTIRATYPRDDLRSARASRRFTIQLGRAPTRGPS